MESHKPKPTAFLDTSVCVSVARGIIPREEWKAAWKHIVNKYEYAISPMTVGEIMMGVIKGDEHHFLQNREPFKVVYPTHKHFFLRLPGHFVMERMLNDVREFPGGEPEDLKRMVRVVLSASSKTALKQGTVILPETPTVRRGIDLEAQAGIISRGKAAFVNRLKRRRAGTLASASPSDAARAWMEMLDKEITTEESARVAGSLDAAYRYEEMLHELAGQPDYDFSRHDSDWIDGQQLFYLCDPQMHFIVHDKRIKERVRGSNQADRILLYQEIRDLALNKRASAKTATGRRGT